MHNYFIESFKITKLWGDRDINLTFNRDVNVVIGPNASGKTTILNLLHSILSADVPKLLDVNFEQAEIKLRGFEGRSVRTITARTDAPDNILELRVGQNKFLLDTDAISRRRFPVHYREETGRITRRTLRPHLKRGIVPDELYDELTALVPLVWLPVSRRLPVTEDEEERYTRPRDLESVDARLEELLRELFHYYSRLNAQLSERYKAFEHQVLSVILYSKEHDQLKSFPPSLPTEPEKDQLRRAFKAAGLLDEQMQSRINDHFAAAEESAKRMHESKDGGLELEDILVLPLIGRTKTMVEYARKLEEERERIFAPLRRYEETVNSFLNNKSLQVDDSGQLKIKSFSSSDLDSSHLSSDLDSSHLSSGEKQILILLTEALLRVDKPVVYIADEPELSLHVTWQEKLLESLVTLGGKIQVIVATHSPDIVGKFQDKVINLGEER